MILSLAFAVKTNSARQKNYFSDTNKKENNKRKKKVRLLCKVLKLKIKLNIDPEKEKSHAAPPPHFCSLASPTNQR